MTTIDHLATFKTEILNLLEHSNIEIEGGKVKDIFSLDSAHDVLFDNSLAQVTTSFFQDMPVGVSGEDRYVWYLREKGLLDNVKYFGVQETKDKKNPSRQLEHPLFRLFN